MRVDLTRMLKEDFPAFVKEKPLHPFGEEDRQEKVQNEWTLTEIRTNLKDMRTLSLCNSCPWQEYTRNEHKTEVLLSDFKKSRYFR